MCENLALINAFSAYIQPYYFKKNDTLSSIFHRCLFCQNIGWSAFGLSKQNLLELLKALYDHCVKPEE
jgi:hypothetical protein